MQRDIKSVVQDEVELTDRLRVHHMLRDFLGNRTR
jgi:hypothetical protein